MGSQESESLGSKRVLLNSTSELSHSAPPVYHETSAIYHETSAIERPIESAVPRAPVESVSTAPTDVSYDKEAPLSSGKSRNESSDFNPPCHQNYEHVIAGLTALSMESTLKGNISNRIENEYNGNLSLKTTNRVIKQASVETPQFSTPDITLIGPGNIRMDADRVEEDQSVLNGLKPLDRKIVSFFREELLILYRAEAWENLEPVVSEYLAKLASLSRSANIEIERELIRWSIVLARAKGARGFYKDSADILKPWENTKGELRAVIQHLQAFNVLGFESDIQNAQTYCTQAYLSEEHSFGRASVATIELMVITLRRLGKMIEAEFYNSLLDPRNNIRYSSGTLGAVLQPYHLHLSYGVRSISINGKDGDIIKAWDDCVNYPDDNKLLLMLLNIDRDTHKYRKTHEHPGDHGHMLISSDGLIPYLEFSEYKPAYATDEKAREMFNAAPVRHSSWDRSFSTVLQNPDEMLEAVPEFHEFVPIFYTGGTQFLTASVREAVFQRWESKSRGRPRMEQPKGLRQPWSYMKRNPCVPPIVCNILDRSVRWDHPYLMSLGLNAEAATELESLYTRFISSACWRFAMVDAEGTVVVLMPADWDEEKGRNSFWSSIELPTLKENPKVTSIIAVIFEKVETPSISSFKRWKFVGHLKLFSREGY